MMENLSVNHVLQNGNNLTDFTKNILRAVRYVCGLLICLLYHLLFPLMLYTNTDDVIADIKMSAAILYIS